MRLNFNPIFLFYLPCMIYCLVLFAFVCRSVFLKVVSSCVMLDVVSLFHVQVWYNWHALWKCVLFLFYIDLCVTANFAKLVRPTFFIHIIRRIANILNELYKMLKSKWTTIVEYYYFETFIRCFIFMWKYYERYFY